MPGYIMKKSVKFLISVFALNLLILSTIFADGYHVCVASYRNLKNAEAMVQKLEKQSMAAFVSENKVKNQSFYRVLLSKEFKKIEDARKYRDEVKNYSFVKELGLKGFWVSEGKRIKTAPAAKKIVPSPAPAPVPAAVPAPLPKVEPIPKPKIIEAPKTEILAPVVEPPVKNIVPEVIPEEPKVEDEPAPLPEPEPPVEETPIEEVPTVEPEFEVPEETEPLPVIIVEEPKTLERNEKAVLSEETPYSVLVRSYKYEQFAENDYNRLKEIGFEPYILKTFDDKEFFAFNLHAGAFATQEEAEALCGKFTEAGIADTTVSNFNEIEEKLRQYDEIIARESVSFDDGQSEMPTCIPETVSKLVKQFPANKDFPIQEITIIDCDNYRQSRERPVLSNELLSYLSEENTVHSALLAKCRDELYRKELTVFFANADNFPTDDILGEFEEMQFGATDGVFDCVLYEKDGSLVLAGSNLAEKMFVKITTTDFTKQDFINHLIDSFNDGSLSLYPQMRRTFYILPDNAEDTERNFISFNFKKVGEEYAIDRNNAEWAIPIVGHSLAKSYFKQNNSLLCIGFYDLDYDFNAKSVHAHFTSAKNTTEISTTNQPVTINGIDGWFLVNATQKEISFSTKSYVIALDTEPNSFITKDDLIKVGSDLKIWDSSDTMTVTEK